MQRLSRRGPTCRASSTETCFPPSSRFFPPPCLPILPSSRYCSPLTSSTTALLHSRTPGRPSSPAPWCNQAAPVAERLNAGAGVPRARVVRVGVCICVILLQTLQTCYTSQTFNRSLRNAAHCTCVCESGGGSVCARVRVCICMLDKCGMSRCASAPARCGEERPGGGRLELVGVE